MTLNVTRSESWQQPKQPRAETMATTESLVVYSLYRKENEEEANSPVTMSELLFIPPDFHNGQKQQSAIYIPSWAPPSVSNSRCILDRLHNLAREASSILRRKLDRVVLLYHVESVLSLRFRFVFLLRGLWYTLYSKPLSKNHNEYIRIDSKKYKHNSTILTNNSVLEAKFQTYYPE